MFNSNLTELSGSHLTRQEIMYQDFYQLERGRPWPQLPTVSKTARDLSL